MCIRDRYFGKPMIYDEQHSHFMYPNEARIRNMTYGISIHVDVEVEFDIINEEGVKETPTLTLDKILLGRFPIMLQSKLCILNGLNRHIREQMGECKNDMGGYFIIGGKEKVIVSQQKFGDNMMYIKDNYNDQYSHSAEIRSVSENPAKPVRTTSVKMVRPNHLLTNNQLVVSIANIRQPIPLFIVMRALGIISDKKIIEYCLLDIDNMESYMEYFIPSVHDSGQILTKQSALEYMASFTKSKTVHQVLEILSDYFLAHVGENNYTIKAYFLGYMVNKLLRVVSKVEQPTDLSLIHI